LNREQIVEALKKIHAAITEINVIREYQESGVTSLTEMSDNELWDIEASVYKLRDHMLELHGINFEEIDR
jgi:CO dehydrogenase/acetyl-CoA synthase epsilon subunit